MATGGVPQKSSSSEGNTVRLFVTSYTDDFFAERELFKREILQELRSWCESKQLSLSEKYVKWGSQHPEKRDPAGQEKAQTSIENCYYNNVMPIFLNFTSEVLGWVPMWGEYPDELIEDYLEAYGLLVEDLEVMYGAYREDNQNSLFLIRQDSVEEDISETDRQYFIQKSSASTRIQQYGDKVSQKFPPGRIVKYHCKFMGLDSRKHPQLKFEDNFKQIILDFCKQRILFDFCGEQLQSFSSQDNEIRRQHETFMRKKGSVVLGREDVLLKVNTVELQWFRQLWNYENVLETGSLS